MEPKSRWSIWCHTKRHAAFEVSATRDEVASILGDLARGAGRKRGVVQVEAFTDQVLVTRNGRRFASAVPEEGT